MAHQSVGNTASPSGDITMSVLVVSPGDYSSVRMTVSYLADQTIRGSLELVIVAPSRDELNLTDSDVAVFHSVQIVEVGAIVFRGKASAAVVRVARGPIVAMVENHAFPLRGWAEALVKAHRGPWVGICPQVEIFNPGTVYSRAERLIDYGNWVGHDTSVEIERLPWHNASYKRRALMQYDSELESLLEPEEELQRRLRSRGHRFYVEARAKVLHVSDSVARSAYKASFRRGRGFAAARSRDWSLGRKVAYVVCSPVFPFRRLLQLRDNCRRFRKRHPILPLIPAVLGLLVTTAVGECAGYLFGEGDPDHWMALHELDIGLRANPDEIREMDNLLRRRLGTRNA